MRAARMLEVKTRASLLALLLLLGCRQSPTPKAAEDPLSSLLNHARSAAARDDRETEALDLRQAVELLGAKRPHPAELQRAREQCAEAMVQAGGNVASYRLWKGMGEKNPGAKMEAGRMAERARKLMLQQGQELTAQVKIDLEANRAEAAACTARAALALLKEAKAEPEELSKATKTVEKATAQRDKAPVKTAKAKARSSERNAP